MVEKARTDSSMKIAFLMPGFRPWTCPALSKWAPDPGKYRQLTTLRFFAESAVPLVYVLANVANARPVRGIERQYLKKDHELLKQVSKMLHTHPNTATALHNPNDFDLGFKIT